MGSPEQPDPGADAPCPVTAEQSLAALRLECQAIDAIVGAAVGEDLARPTRLEGWRVEVLLAHLVRGVDRLHAYVRAPEPLAVEVSWLAYWRQVRTTSDPDGVSRRAREFAASIHGRPVHTVWEETWTQAVTEAATVPPARVLKTPNGAMRLDHYLTTRVLEVTVHGLDLRDALGLEQVATPLGIEVTAAVLDALLGVPRPVDLERHDLDFILAAAGRERHTDPDLPLIS